VLVDEGRGDAALGSPLLAVAWLVAHLKHAGEGLRAGEVVLTGGLTRAHSLPAGHTVQAQFGGGLGTVVLQHR